MFRYLLLLVVFLPLAQQPTVGFGLSNNVLPFFPICDQLSPSSHSQHLKISFYFLLPSFPGSSLLLVPSNFWVKIFWASYPPPFSLGDLTSLSFALLSTAPQTAANKQWRHTGVWLCIISDKTTCFYQHNAFLGQSNGPAVGSGPPSFKLCILCSSMTFWEDITIHMKF